MPKERGWSGAAEAVWAAPRWPMALALPWLVEPWEDRKEQHSEHTQTDALSAVSPISYKGYGPEPRKRDPV